MKKTAHTPGPWFFDVHPDNTQAVLVDQEGFSIIYLSKPFPNDLSKDARLIAAAPDMLDALQSLVDAYQTHFDVMPVAWQTFDNIARDAIAKAKGE